MKRGKTEAETLKLNGWGVGDILEGDEGFGPDQILITAVGVDGFLCRWKRPKEVRFGKEKGNTTLSCREWVKVGSQSQWQGPQDGLPPVGCTHEDCICIFVEHGEFEILAHRDNEAVIYFKDKGSDEWSVDLALPGQFCPIQSERDKIIDAAMALSEAGLTDTKWLNRLFDSGMLVDPERKPMSREDAHQILVEELELKGEMIRFSARMAILDALGYKE